MRTSLRCFAAAALIAAAGLFAAPQMLSASAVTAEDRALAAALEAGGKALDEGRFADAEKIFNDAAKTAKTAEGKGRALALRGWAQVRQKNKPAARTSLTESEAASPDDPVRARLALDLAYFVGDLDAGLRSTNVLIERAPHELRGDATRRYSTSWPVSITSSAATRQTR